MWVVYVLKSTVNGRSYTGSTNDINRRLSEHNSGKSKYTRSTRPFILIHKEAYNTRLEARRRELFLKSGKGRKIVKEILAGVVQR